jgi:peptidoglycan/xylan/chitin deacetylase (PgdA/CDA1 family)
VNDFEAADNPSMSSLVQRSSHRLSDRDEKEFGLTLPVLLYHRIAPDLDGPCPELTISPQDFKCQLDWLVEHRYSSIRPSDWLGACNGATLPPRPVLITFDDAYADTARYGLPVLIRHGFLGAVYVITHRIGHTVEWDGRPVMTEEQIKAWAAEGVEFGAHSRTHPDLTKLSPHRLANEIIGSKDDLENITGARVSSFAYPYGVHNEEVRNCVKSAFDLAFTCEDGMSRLASDPILVPRIEIRPSRFAMNFALQVKLGYDPVRRLRRRVALRSRIRKVISCVAIQSPRS